LSALLAALASGLLLLLAGFLLATATLLTALTRLLLLLTGILTAATLLAALAWILVSHDLDSPAGEFPRRTTFVPQVRSSATNAAAKSAPTFSRRKRSMRSLWSTSE
jgi:hypothetical protein